jgi:hypothetical protein
VVLVHGPLRGADHQNPARRLRYKKGFFEHRACLHQPAAPGGRPLRR